MAAKDLETIYCRTKVKIFLEDMNTTLKRRLGKFVPIADRLIYYLIDSERFMKDFEKYSSTEESDLDLLKLLTKVKHD